MSRKGKKPVPYSDSFGYRDGFRIAISPNVQRDRKAVIESYYTRLLTELSVTRFRWNNLPETCNERFLELELFIRGLCVFYKSEKFGYVTLRGSGNGQRNIYDDPTSFRVMGGAFFNAEIGAKNCVPIWGNSTRYPDLDIVAIHATRLAEMDRTIEINALQMRSPTVIVADESERLTYENVIRQRDEGMPSIIGSRNLDMARISAFNIAPHQDSVINMQIAKSKVWNDCMTALGINNANQEKRERLVSAEVDANTESVERARESSLRARQDAAAAINRKYGLNVSVEWAGDANVSLDYADNRNVGRTNTQSVAVEGDE